MIARIPALLVAVLLLVPSGLGAQASDVPGAVHFRNDCRRAAQVLTTGHPAERRAWALDLLTVCTRESPPVLVRLWQTTSADTQQIGRLITASARVRDDRIYQQMRATVLDATRPDLVRVGAMVVLMHYAVPHSGMSVYDLLPPPGPIGRIRSQWSSEVDFVQEEGAEPIPDPVNAPLVELLNTVVRTEQNNRVVSYAAATLLKTLE